MSAHEDWTTPPVTEHEAIPALAGDLGVHDSQAPARDTGWMRGPGNAGSYWCNCDDPIALDWPEWTTDEDRATMLRLRDRHAATHKTSSGKSQPLPPAAPEARTPGEEVEPPSPQAPSRPAVTPENRVTWHGPLVAEQQLTSKDEGWVANVRLTDTAARQLGRDLARRHMADLILLNRLTQQERALVGGYVSEAETREILAERARVEARLATALIGMDTVQWTLTPAQAETFHEELEDAQREPDVCTVGTCTAYAEPGLSYCAPHEDGM